MATYNVGGFNPLKRVKTIDLALAMAKDGDEINWSAKGKLSDPLIVASGVHIRGNGSKIVVKEHSPGLYLEGSGRVIFENLYFSAEALSNVISVAKWQGDIEFINCTIEYKSSIKKDKAYPLIMVSRDSKVRSITIKGSLIDGAYLSSTRITIDQSQLDSTYDKGLLLSNEALISDTKLSNAIIKVNEGKLSETSLTGNSARIEVGKELSIASSLIETKTLKLKGKVSISETPILSTTKDLIIEKGEIEFKSLTLHKDLNIQLTDTEMRLGEGVDDNANWTKENSKVANRSTSSQEGHRGAKEALDKMIGLDNVKEVMTKYVSMARIKSARQKAGLVTDDYSLHLVFSGSPGTGKTTVAEIFAQSLYEEGVLPTPKVVKVLRQDLIDNIVGGTAIKTQAVIDSALGGVLFIDEAYSLTSTGDNDFADEAVDTLVPALTEHKGDLVVILAGYTDRMKNFLHNANPGLSSRFTNWVEFHDYTLKELQDIAIANLGRQYKLTERNKEDLISSVEYLYNGGFAEGNGRFIGNLSQEIGLAQSLRLNETGDFSKESLETINETDINEGTIAIVNSIRSRVY